MTVTSPTSMIFFSFWTKVRVMGLTFPLLSRMVTLPLRASGATFSAKTKTIFPLVRALVSTNLIHSFAESSTTTSNSVLYVIFTS